MGYTDIIDMLDTDYLYTLLKRLKKIELQRELFSEETDELTLKEIKILAEAANILAISPKIDDKKKALEICTSLPQVKSSKGIYLSCFLTLRKLGNYPGIRLLEKFTNIEGYKDLLNGISAFEEYIVESFNERTLTDKKYLLTNFQTNALDMVTQNKSVSLSAPTSAGKSFILLQYILDLIYHDPGITVIYVVPTRALIRQVMNDFVERIDESGLKNIYIGSSSETKNLVNNLENSNILVLTQERLYQLCTKSDVIKLKIKLVVVDEAHNIQSEGRGVLLEGAVNYVKTLFPTSQILFSSPLVSNPERLLSTFNIDNGDKEKDDLSLVNQNIIKVKSTRKKLEVSTVYENDEILINTIPFNIKSNSIPSILANVTIKLWNSQNSIIYSNGPMNAVKTIRLLFESENFPILNDERLDEFADFIEEYISEKYELAKFIRCGLAFHFGSLPTIIKSGIEDLFREGVIKIVCCTSTLLEGLNMPAKNIFIYKPEKGQHKPMDSLNFWNLAGRAGRMGHDFSGNIFCINLEDWKENSILEKKQHPISPSSESRLKNETFKFKEYIIDRKKPSGTDDYNEQLVSMIIRNRIKGIELVNSPYVNMENKNELKEIDKVTETIIKEFKPPLTLINRLPGVIPDRINDFWTFLEVNKENINELFPFPPSIKSDKVYNRFKKIIELINKYFLNNKEWSEDYINKLTTVGYKWMSGKPLSKIIFYKTQFYYYDEKKLTKHVKEQIDFLEKDIRFEMVKYTQVYTEILKTFLETNNKIEEANSVINISSYLEFGVCKSPALEFIALGLSREVALRLAYEFDRQFQYTPENYLEWFKALDISTIEMPNYLKNQIIINQSIL